MGMSPHYLSACTTEDQNDRLVFSEEVEHALNSNEPIVALETAIVTHGTPYPASIAQC